MLVYRDADGKWREAATRELIAHSEARSMPHGGMTPSGTFTIKFRDGTVFCPDSDTPAIKSPRRAITEGVLNSAINEQLRASDYADAPSEFPKPIGVIPPCGIDLATLPDVICGDVKLFDLGRCPIVATDAETAERAAQWVEDEAKRRLCTPAPDCDAPAIVRREE